MKLVLNSEELRDHFSQYGEIVSVNVKTGFAFIDYQVADSIGKVIADRDHIINNQRVFPEEANGRTRKSFNGGQALEEFAQENDCSGKIFVGRLIREISDDEIKAYFGQFGNVSRFVYSDRFRELTNCPSDR